MLNSTALYYLLAGSKYYSFLDSKDFVRQVRNYSEKEIEYFFNNRFIRHEKWFRRYLKILIAVFTVNLLARKFERYLSRLCCFYDLSCSRFAPATLMALRAFNKNRQFFNIEFDRFIFLRELIYIVNSRVNEFCKCTNLYPDRIQFIQGNTPLGVEMEFSNKGTAAGRFLERGKGDPLVNFSKYHYYHLTNFMWRFGAYIDSDTPFKQFIKKGGFLEYTFTVPDKFLQTSMPLTNSPDFAGKLINEAVKFTPVQPHSLHITVQKNTVKHKLPLPSFDEILFLLFCSGQFLCKDGKIVESRIVEENMKDIVLLRKRKNYKKWVDTVEFSHMRLCRDFIRRNVYEPSIMLMVAYKNLFAFADIFPYTNKLRQWGRLPYLPALNPNDMFEIIRKGLDEEKALPEHYKEYIVEKVKEFYFFNKSIVMNKTA